MKMASKLLVYTAAATSNQMGGGFFCWFFAVPGGSFLFLFPAKIPSNFLITAASNSMTFYGNDNNLG
ncbi:hypothetical protein [Paenibacillus farraposensis]|uniref:hypothetical protein n=1 Tax=Paenibacillus farraposensis TaxID=2807095 RepID=UPI001E595E79|nr:hypothetical protein [Paenibacillus farraposensis]